MQIKIFTIPTVGGEKLNEELNVFLRSKKILKVDKQLVTDSSGASWSFCISYLEGVQTTKKVKTKIDYKEVLDKESFERFSKMRIIRKKLSQEESLPAYAIFTDAEMAELAKMEDLTLAKMKTIKGVGEKKTEKYGHHFILTQNNEKSE